MSLATMYHRFFPADAAPGPLIVVLHGRGDSMGGFAWMPETLGLPGVSYLFLNAPDDYFGGFSWYGMPPEQGPGVLRSRTLLFRVLDDLLARGWESKDILLFGFSQGCLMAIDVGARYPHPLAGVCGISGYAYFTEGLAEETTEHARQMPWWISAGTNDPVVPASQTADAITAMQAAGIPVMLELYAKAHNIDPVRELPAVREFLENALLKR